MAGPLPRDPSSPPQSNEPPNIAGKRGSRPRNHANRGQTHTAIWVYQRERERTRAHHGLVLATLLALAWPILIVLLALSLSLGCVTGPDGRRVLSPIGRGLVEHVVGCGLQTLASAIGGSPNYLEASRCHLELVEQQLGRKSAETEASEQHGRLVVHAAELEEAGAPAQEVRAVAVQCDSLAREQLGGRP